MKPWKRAIWPNFFCWTWWTKKSRSDIFFPTSLPSITLQYFGDRDRLFASPIQFMSSSVSPALAVALVLLFIATLIWGQTLGAPSVKNQETWAKGDGEACPLTLQYHGGCYVSCSCFLSALRNHTCTGTWLCWMSMFCARFAVFVRRARVLPGPCPATRNLS